MTRSRGRSERVSSYGTFPGMRHNFPEAPLPISLSFYWSKLSHMPKDGLTPDRAIFT